MSNKFLKLVVTVPGGILLVRFNCTSARVRDVRHSDQFIKTAVGYRGIISPALWREQKRWP
jgi:hypothetical protein